MHHYIRQSLLSISLKYKRYLPEKIPLWIVPCEVMKTVASLQGRGWLQYEELLENGGNKEPTLKTKEEIRFNYNWFEYYQIHELYKKRHKRHWN